jgi:hypothetical protein
VAMSPNTNRPRGEVPFASYPPSLAAQPWSHLVRIAPPAARPHGAQDLRDHGLTELLGQRGVLHQQSEIDRPNHAVDHELRIHIRRGL